MKNWKRVKGSNFDVFNLFKNDGPQNIISLIWLPTHELQREPFAVLKVTALHRVTSYDVLSWVRHKSMDMCDAVLTCGGTWWCDHLLFILLLKILLHSRIHINARLYGRATLRYPRFVVIQRPHLCGYRLNLTRRCGRCQSWLNSSRLVRRWERANDHNFALHWLHSNVHKILKARHSRSGWV